MKTVSVRIGEGQAKKLHEVADLAVGSSINGLVQRALDLWIEVEYPVYLSDLKATRDKLKKIRQAVRVAS